jgi:HK97 family phage prohead protease
MGTKIADTTTKSILAADVEWKAGPAAGPGSLEGYASVFGNIDMVGDVVMPGAFRKTISDWRHASQPMPLTVDHNLTTDGLIGSVSDLAEDSHGLKFKARFSRSDKAQRVRQDIIDGHLRGTSFIYEPIRSEPGRFDGKTVRFLQELRLHEITIASGPLIVNKLAVVTSAKAVVDRPWDGSAARFTPEQYRRSCLIDTGQGEVDSKARYKLPVKEPNGDLNRNALGPAAGALAGARTAMTGVSDEQKARAARALMRLYGETDMDPPESLRRMAGMMSSAQIDWAESMGHAMAIRDEWARKAAVDSLVATYPADDLTDLVADPGDAPVTTDTGAADGTPDPATLGDTAAPPAADVYAVAFLNQGPPDEAPSDGPPEAPAVLAVLEQQRSNEEIDTLEADIRAALGGLER